jgi:hypothetical protein
MPVTLGEEVMLLSLDQMSGKVRESQSAAQAVGGGFLLDLALADRVLVHDGELEVVDTTPTGEPLLDSRLCALAEWTGRRSRTRVADWLSRDRSQAPVAALESLCHRGLVVERRRRALGVLPIRRYPQADGRQAREVRERLSAVVQYGQVPDERTSALISLVYGASLYALALPGVPRRQVERRMAEVADGLWVRSGPGEAIRSLRAAIAAVTVTTAVHMT